MYTPTDWSVHVPRPPAEARQAMVFEIVQGSSWSSPAMELRDGAGDLLYPPPAVVQVAASLWAGDDQQPACAADAAWDAGAGQFQLRLPSATTATLAPSLYRLVLSARLLTDAESVRRPIGFVRVLPAPGTTTAPLKVYCTLDDCLQYAPWLLDLVTSDPSMQSDLAEQRARARAWLDDVILAADRPAAAYGAASPSDPSFSPRWGMGAFGDTGPNPWLRAQLNDDKLIVRPLTREITARKAISLLSEPQTGAACGGGATPYQLLAQKYEAVANALVAGYVAEINTTSLPNDEVYAAGYIVRCGVKSSR